MSTKESNSYIRYIQKVICKGCDVCKRKTEYGYQYVPHILSQTDVTEEIERKQRVLTDIATGSVTSTTLTGNVK